MEWKLPHCGETRQDAGGNVECVKEDDIHTLIFVDKNLDKFKEDLFRRIAEESAVSLAVSPSPVDLMQQRIANMRDPGIRQGYLDDWLDPGKLVLNNDCLSPALYRYEQNLIRFIEEESLLPPILPLAPRPILQSVSPPLPRGLPVIPGLNYMAVDYGRFVVDVRSLIPGNRDYQINLSSVKNVRAASRDTLGRPTLITFDFEWQDDSHTPASMGVVFVDGVPTQVARWYPVGPRDRATNYNFDIPTPKQVTDFLAGNYNLKPR